jgi:hypothetical protein
MTAASNLKVIRAFMPGDKAITGPAGCRLITTRYCEVGRVGADGLSDPGFGLTRVGTRITPDVKRPCSVLREALPAPIHLAPQGMSFLPCPRFAALSGSLRSG